MLLKLLFAAILARSPYSTPVVCIIALLSPLSFNLFNIMIIMAEREYSFSNTFFSFWTMRYTITINFFKRLFSRVRRLTSLLYVKEDCFDYCSVLLKCIVKVFKTAQNNQVALIRTSFKWKRRRMFTRQIQKSWMQAKHAYSLLVPLLVHTLFLRCCAIIFIFGNKISKKS